MKKVLSFLAIFVSAATAFAEKPKLAEKNATWFTVRVDNGNGSGTGTVIASDKDGSYILTNAHVCETASDTIVVEHEKKAYRATYIHGSHVNHLRPGLIRVEGPDLCLIHVKAELPCVKLATEPPQHGEKVWQKGFERGVHTPVFKEGVTTRNFSVKPEISTTIVSVPGDSGSGIFNEDGELVGVCWGGSGFDEVGVPVVAVHSFIMDPHFDTHLVTLRIAVDVRKMSPAPTRKAVPNAPPACPGGKCPRR